MRFDPGYFGGNRKIICHMGVLAMQDSAQITRAEGGYFFESEIASVTAVDRAAIFSSTASTPFNPSVVLIEPLCQPPKARRISFWWWGGFHFISQK